MKSRFSEEQIIGLLEEHEAGVSAAQICRHNNVSPPTFYNWKAKYGGMNVDEAKRLKQLEEANAKLERIVADLTLDNVALKDMLSKLVKPAARREVVRYLQSEYDLPRRGACELVDCHRGTARRISQVRDDVQLRERLKELIGGRKPGLGLPDAVRPAQAGTMADESQTDPSRVPGRTAGLASAEAAA